MINFLVDHQQLAKYSKYTVEGSLFSQFFFLTTPSINYFIAKYGRFCLTSATGYNYLVSLFMKIIFFSMADTDLILSYFKLDK